MIKGREGERVDVFQKDWLHRDDPGGRRKKLRTIWLAEEVGSTDTAVAELKAIVGHVFESPKPTGLVRRILQTMPADAVVLDFFAGCGHDGPRGRPAERRRRRHPALHQRELRRARPARLQRRPGRVRHGRRHHAGAAAGRRGDHWVVASRRRRRLT